jgi:hypothetical protein
MVVCSFGFLEKKVQTKYQSSPNFKPYIWTMGKEMEMTVVIPVKAPVYRYCESQYGSTKIKVSSSNAAIYSAFQLLHHPNHYIDNGSETIESDYKLELIIPSELRKSNKFFLSDNHIRVFNKLIEGLLTDQLFLFLDLRPDTMEIKEGIAHFKSKLGLTEDEWQYETLKKKYYRYRENSPRDNKSFRVSVP